MDTVIGLFPANEDISTKIKKLKTTGYSENRIEIITQIAMFLKMIGIDRNDIVLRYAAVGSFFGILIYGTFAFAAGWCECAYFDFDRSTLYSILVIGVLVGLLIGGVIGAISGMAKFEESTQLYTRGISLGNSVIVLQTELDKLENAKQSLNSMGCTGIKTISELRK